MRLLSPELTAAQKQAPLAYPKLKVEIKNKRASVVHLVWERLYTGSEYANHHGVAMPSDGSLIRIYIAANNHLYRQRVVNPDEESDYTSWTDVGAAYVGCNIAICANGATVLIFWCDPDGYTIKYIFSITSGATWSDPVTLVTLVDHPNWLAAAMKPDGDVCLIYSHTNTISARKYTGGSWTGPYDRVTNPTHCNGLAIVYHDDWNILITGDDADDNRCVWQCVFGDGNQATLNTWTDLDPIMQMATDSNYKYFEVFLDYIDTFRAFWVEYYDLATFTWRNYWTHSIPGKDFIDNLWREPIPFNLNYLHTVALCHSATHAWATTPDGVWRASIAETTWDITNAVIAATQNLTPKTFNSTLKTTLDNTTGTYNDFSKLGYEIILSLGYVTTAGNEYSATPSFWITGWKFVSPPWFPLHMIYPYGVIGTLDIEAEDIWDHLKGWKARRPFSWAVGTKTVHQLLEFVLARAGFELDVISASTAIDNFKPAFEIKEGYTGLWAVKKLLSYVEDVLIQKGAKLYLKQPLIGDTVDYTYNSMYYVAHIVYRGSYGTHQWTPNRAQVWGTTLMVEKFEWDQVDPVFDKLSRVEKPTYPDVTRAGERADAELRKGEMWTGSGGYAQVPVNCGQEIFDIISLTDYTAGIVALIRRVIAIKTTYNAKSGSYLQMLQLGLP
jgi:hypothetical protein